MPPSLRHPIPFLAGSKAKEGSRLHSAALRSCIPMRGNMVQCTPSLRRLYLDFTNFGQPRGQRCCALSLPSPDRKLEKTPAHLQTFAHRSGTQSPGAHYRGVEEWRLFPTTLHLSSQMTRGRSASFTVEWLPHSERAVLSSPPPPPSHPYHLRRRAKPAWERGPTCAAWRTARPACPGQGASWLSSLPHRSPAPTFPPEQPRSRGGFARRRGSWEQEQNGRGGGGGEVRGALGVPLPRPELAILFRPQSRDGHSNSCLASLPPARRMNEGEKPFPPPPPHFRSLRASVTSAQQFH